MLSKGSGTSVEGNGAGVGGYSAVGEVLSQSVDVATDGSTVGCKKRKGNLDG